MPFTYGLYSPHSSPGRQVPMEEAHSGWVSHPRPLSKQVAEPIGKAREMAT